MSAAHAELETGSAIAPDGDDVRDPVHVLIDRLDRGWALCEASVDPDERSRLDAHWITLLRDYEAACIQGRGRP